VATPIPVSRKVLADSVVDIPTRPGAASGMGLTLFAACA